MAYSESESHVLEKVKDFWLGNWSRAHDAIVVKIDKDQAPLRMQVSYIPKYILSASHFKEFNLPGMALLCQGQSQKINGYPASDLCNVINKEYSSFL